LVEIALQWQNCFGVAPAITSIISELDAALLVGMTEREYRSDCMQRTAVTMAGISSLVSVDTK
jgi:hypothetical protein